MKVTLPLKPRLVGKTYGLYDKRVALPMAKRDAGPTCIVRVHGITLTAIDRNEPSGSAVVKDDFLWCLNDLLRRGLPWYAGRQATEGWIDVDHAEVEASYLIPEFRFVDGFVPCHAALQYGLVRFERSHAANGIWSCG